MKSARASIHLQEPNPTQHPEPKVFRGKAFTGFQLQQVNRVYEPISRRSFRPHLTANWLRRSCCRMRPTGPSELPDTRNHELSARSSKAPLSIAPCGWPARMRRPQPHGMPHQAAQADATFEFASRYDWAWYFAAYDFLIASIGIWGLFSLRSVARMLARVLGDS